MQNAEIRKDATVMRTSATGDDALTWSPGLSHAVRRRWIYSGLLTASTGLIGLAVVPVAYLMLYSWPASIGDPQQYRLDVIGTLAGVIQLVGTPEFAAYVPLFVLAPIVLLVTGQFFRLHTFSQRTLAPFREVPAALKATAASVLILAGIGHGLGRGFADQSQLEAVLFYIYAGALSAMGLVLAGSGIRIANGLLQLRGIGQTNVAVIVDDTSVSLLDSIADDGAHHYVGAIAVNDAAKSQAKSPIGDLEALEKAINENNVDEVILAVDQGQLTPDQRHTIAQACWKLGVDLRILPPFHPYFQTTGETEMVGDVPLLIVRRSGLNATRSQAIKRAMDIAVASSVLLVTSPVLLATAIAIKLESRGPMLFKQTRPGLYGRVFNIMKFRSMYADADHDAHREAQKALIQEGVAAEYDKDGRPIYGKVAKDPRITHVGRFIRRTSIDELPQLVNVLRGEMSLVGPRPSVLYELENYKDWHMRRLAIRPGITGLWQVSGRSRLSFDQMVELDIHYIENWSLWLDIVILAKTLPAVINVDRAY
jgi:exopolysaccharide biosynthesis polyprenyl glycosylphosphotransferase